MALWPAPSNLASMVRKVVADPAAGNEFTFTVPAGKTWQLLAVSVSLAQGITQTPQPVLIIDDGTNPVFEGFGSSAAQAVSTTCFYTWAPGLTLTGQVGSGAGVVSQGALPPGLPIGPGFRVRSSTIGIGANSDYGVPACYVVEYG